MTTKFKKIEEDPTELLKKHLNSLISEIRNTPGTSDIKKINGHYQPGYVYANLKIHKSLHNPPFGPFISQIGTVTYEISKIINSIVVKYLPKQYQVGSTYEFLTLLKDNQHPGMLASLDVDNLFTNVPVSDTIDIII